MRYLITFSYDGTRYHGYQKQNNDISIQSEIETVLTKINSNIPVIIHATGRTDAGVHALNQKAHFDLDKDIDIERLKCSMNKLLPNDIYIKKIEVVSNDFHARFNVKSKEYIYKINVGDYDAINIFGNKVYYSKNAYDALEGAEAMMLLTEWNEFKYLDIDKMSEALQYFKGEHNFKSFTKTTDEIKDYVRTIFNASISLNDNIIVISLIGNGFLRYMVRNIVGTLIEIGLGVRKPNEIDELLNAEDRNVTGKTAPSCGLYLKDIIY